LRFIATSNLFKENFSIKGNITLVSEMEYDLQSPIDVSEHTVMKEQYGYLD